VKRRTGGPGRRHRGLGKRGDCAIGFRGFSFAAVVRFWYQGMRGVDVTQGRRFDRRLRR
jgi:hypothetical protein